MANFSLMRQLARPGGGKIVLLILDGLGGLPMGEYKSTTLEYAQTPNMDRLAAEGCSGLSHPIGESLQAADRLTWLCLATIRSIRPSAAAYSQLWASALTCFTRTSPRAGTSALWTATGSL